jgi:hypothetical protein
MPALAKPLRALGTTELLAGPFTLEKFMASIIAADSRSASAQIGMFQDQV